MKTPKFQYHYSVVNSETGNVIYRWDFDKSRARRLAASAGPGYKVREHRSLWPVEGDIVRVENPRHELHGRTGEVDRLTELEDFHVMFENNDVYGPHSFGAYFLTHSIVTVERVSNESH